MRHIYQSFGIKSKVRPLKYIFELFSETPVKLLKDVLEALQLYDLVEVLPEKPQKARSLRLALPLEEIEKLRKTADSRPTTIHSSAAVLIIADKENSSTEGIKNFFKGLNSKSDVTIIDCNNLSRIENELQKKREELHEEYQKKQEVLHKEFQKEQEVLHKEFQKKEEELHRWFQKKKEELQKKFRKKQEELQNEFRKNQAELQKEFRKKQEELQKEFPKKQEELQKEIENITTAASAVINRWIHNQGW